MSLAIKSGVLHQWTCCTRRHRRSCHVSGCNSLLQGNCTAAIKSYIHVVSAGSL